MAEHIPSRDPESPRTDSRVSEPDAAGDSVTHSPSVASPPATGPALTERNPFQSSALVFVLLRFVIYLLLSYSLINGLPRLFLPLFRSASSPFTPRILVLGELIFAAGAYIPAWGLSLLEKRPFGAYGLPLRGAFGKLFWQGTVLGLAEINAVIAAMAALGAYRFGSIAIHGAALLRYAVFWALFFLLVGLVEEFLYRGYVQFTLSQAIGFWPAAILLSVAFGLVHKNNPGENWTGVAGVILTGLLWCFTLRRTGSLWLAVGMHASFDFGETFLYSVPDSGFVFPGHLSNATIAGPAWLTGGSVGPEASVFDFVVLLIFFLVIHRLYPARPAPATAPVTEAPPVA